MTLQEIACETAKDSDLQTVIQNVKSGTWTNRYGENRTSDTLAQCTKNEPTIFTHEIGDLLLHETRLVIPKSLQKKVIATAHGHGGILRTKQLLQEKLYFPKH